jgi:hypothetical protein
MKTIFIQLTLLVFVASQANLYAGETNGLVSNLSKLPPSFTVSPAYREAALKAMLAEANVYAQRLNLAENLPITKTSLAGFHISTPYVANRFGALGNLSTTNYSYAFSRGRRLSSITRLPKDKSNRTLFEKFKPWAINVSEVNTNAAFSLATQFLVKAFVDLPSLSNSTVIVQPVTILSMTTSVYRIEWQQGGTTLVEVGLAETNKELWGLHVDDAQYILRPPISLPMTVDDYWSQSNTIALPRAKSPEH